LQVSPEKGMQVYAATLDDLNLDARTKRILRDVLRPQEQQVDPAYVKKLEDMLKQVTGQTQQAQMAKLAADTQLSAARAQEAEAKVKKTEADTVKAIEESQKIGVETMKGLAVPAEKTSLVV
jgi:gluconate kinase